MQRPQLEHIIRAAVGLTGAQPFIIIIIGECPTANSHA